MNIVFANPGSRRRLLVAATLIPCAFIMTGCDDDSDGDSPPDSATLTGTFVDSPVSGLNVSGTETPAGTTNENGQFSYQQGETLTFSIGELSLGSAIGADTVTPLDVASGASSTADPQVVNRLVLLQSLDADGDLNNGIQITQAIRDAVSANAGSLDFGFSESDFSDALSPVITSLEALEAFTDTDPQPRSVVSASDATGHFARSTSPRLVVETDTGAVRGFEAAPDTWQFLGIPYARPPLGHLRWQPPQPMEPWEGVREAVSWSDQSAQNPALQAFGEGGMSEDSLYLNVTAPKEADGLPVMVWFHGGGFTSLTGNTVPFNNPDALVSKGVVQVAVNHRLGPFGYIAHPDLSQESGYGGSGNYGQMDLVAALEWVQDNIREFGGDPDNVTIFGESGGGRKVLSLMASPKAAGLFHKAISQSGTLYPDTRSLEDAEAIGEQLQSQLAVSSLAEMRAAPWTDVVTAAASLAPYTNVDNAYLPTTERIVFESGNQNDVPFMFLINTNDTPDPTQTVIDVFPWMEPLSSSPFYATLFSHQPSGWKARGVEAYHAAELAYVFNMPQSVVTHYRLGLVIDPATGESLDIGDLNGNGVTGSEGDPADIFVSAGFDQADSEVIERMLTIWTNFAKTGDPGIPGTLEYPQYDAAAQQYVEIGAETEVKSGLSSVLDEDE